MGGHYLDKPSIASSALIGKNKFELNRPVRRYTFGPNGGIGSSNSECNGQFKQIAVRRERRANDVAGQIARRLAGVRPSHGPLGTAHSAIMRADDRRRASGG